VTTKKIRPYTDDDRSRLASYGNTVTSNYVAELFRTKKISRVGLLIIWEIARYLNIEDADWCDLTNQQLAERISCNRTYISDTISELIKLGVVETSYVEDKRYLTTGHGGVS